VKEISYFIKKQKCRCGEPIIYDFERGLCNFCVFEVEKKEKKELELKLKRQKKREKIRGDNDED